MGFLGRGNAFLFQLAASSSDDGAGEGGGTVAQGEAVRKPAQKHAADEITVGFLNIGALARPSRSESNELVGDTTDIAGGSGVNPESFSDFAAELIPLHLAPGAEERLKVRDIIGPGEVRRHEVFGMLFAGGKKRA